MQLQATSMSWADLGLTWADLGLTWGRLVLTWACWELTWGWLGLIWGWLELAGRLPWGRRGASPAASAPSLLPNSKTQPRLYKYNVITICTRMHSFINSIREGPQMPTRPNAWYENMCLVGGGGGFGASGALGIDHGMIQDRLRIDPGSILDRSWMDPGSILNRPWVDPGSTMTSHCSNN